MLKSCEHCGKEYESKTARSKYCSHNCRALRNKGVAQPADQTVAQPVFNGNVSKSLICTDGLQSSLICTKDQPCQHCQSKSTNKSKNIINHEQYKTADELEEDEVNRVSLPGDSDYDSPSPKIDDVDVDRMLDADMLRSLPEGVVRPKCSPTLHTKSMANSKLYSMLESMHDWKSSPYYAEVIYRLLTEDKPNQCKPSWRKAC